MVKLPLYFYGLNCLYLKFKREIEGQVVIEDWHKILGGLGKGGCIKLNFLAILMPEIKKALSYWKQNASGNMICHGWIVLSCFLEEKNKIAFPLFLRFKKRVLIQHLERILEELEFNSLPNRVNHVNSR